MIEVLYESGPVLVVNKPAGIATQSPPGIESMASRVKAFLKERDGKPGNIYLGVPHRLDRPVSGAMVFARHVRAAHRLSKQFEARTVGKRYWACVTGTAEPECGTWCDTMRKIPDQPRSEIVTADHPDAQSAVLTYRTLGQATIGSHTLTWLEIELETGRMHQIRLQAAARGHAVLGDVLYGSELPFGPATDDPRQRAIALHARSLSFVHPMTREPVSILAPPPVSWNALGFEMAADA